jgi:predicted nicotinamide N-methyase
MEREDQVAREEEEEPSSCSRRHSNDASFTTLFSGMTIFQYNHFLKEQAYYDDLKHVDYSFIDYGTIGSGQLIVEQQKSLGKGGFCWDAAYILADHLIHENAIPDGTRVLELGSGTGLCGLMLAKALNVHVCLTDLPTVLPLLERNSSRNFESMESDDCLLSQYQTDTSKQSKGQVSVFPLDWSVVKEDSEVFNVVIGADVVASLYDPVALARTIRRLSHNQSTIYISFKERLSTVHRQFEEAMVRESFEIEIIHPTSRNRNPEVRILVARSKL